MRRKLLIAGVALIAVVASTVRVQYQRLGWGAYWSVDFVAPWRR